MAKKIETKKDFNLILAIVTVLQLFLCTISFCFSHLVSLIVYIIPYQPEILYTVLIVNNYIFISNIFKHQHKT